MASALIVRDLRKTFPTKLRKGFFKSEKGTVEAVRGVSFTIEEGELFGLLGPNGAGKTTIIKCLTTLLLPTTGEIEVNGFVLPKEEQGVRASLGCMLMGERGLYWKLTGRENLQYFASLYHIPSNLIRERVDFLIDDMELGEFADRAVESYSSGQKMLTSFAKALISDPPILFLDEPTATIDVPNARRLRAKVKELHREGKTIIFTTHLMHEADELCDRIAIIDHGKIIAEGIPSEMKAAHQQERVIDVEGSFPPRVREGVGALAGVTQVVAGESTTSGERLTIHSGTDVPIPIILHRLEELGSSVSTIQNRDPTLEDVFVELTGRSLSVDTALKSEAKVK